MLWPHAGGPGSCLVLEEKYCGIGKFIYPFEDSVPAIGFKLPEGAAIYAPYNGLTGFLTVSGNQPGSDNSSLVIYNVESADDLGADHNAIIIFTDGFLKGEIHETVVKGQLLARAVETPLPDFGDFNLVMSLNNPENKGTVYADPGFYLKDSLSL
jgi:hypothetical protein